MEARSRRLKFSASVASRAAKLDSKVEILVRASTRRRMSGPNSSASSSPVVGVSSSRSCSSPTVIATSSSSMSARIHATVRGWIR